MGRPRGSQHLTVRAVVGTWRRVEELHGAGMSYRDAQEIVAEETPHIGSRGAVEYRYKIGAEWAPKVDAAAAAYGQMRRTVEFFRRGDPLAGVRRTLSFLSQQG